MTEHENKPLNTDTGTGTEHEGNEQGHNVGPHPNRVRRRIKVRKRVRIKKKPSSKKKFKKIGEKLFWIGLVIAFIVSLIIMIVQLDISDKKFRNSGKRGAR